jgi:hypothetical protein
VKWILPRLPSSALPGRGNGRTLEALRTPGVWTFLGFSPKGINSSAQGCVAGATLGQQAMILPFPEGEEQMGVGFLHPFQGRPGPSAPESQGSGSAATLGYKMDPLRGFNRFICVLMTSWNDT